MTARGALWAALLDFYGQSWRLLLLNAALGAFLVAVILAGLWMPLAWGLVLLAGPLAMALMHCAVEVAQTEDLRLRSALDGLRLHWRRGLVLGALGVVVTAAGLVAVFSYGSGSLLAWPLAALAAYLLALFGLYQLLLWPLAAFEEERPFRAVAREAALSVLRRPLQACLLFVALLLVNLAGVAAALMPFLTLTVAYSFLAAAHFALPRSPLREAGT
jgi:hypothetical protein